MAVISAADVLEEPYRGYWLALGKFIGFFSETEDQLRYALRRFSGVSKTSARALFANIRVADGISSINRLLEANGRIRAKARLAKPFAQLGLINTTRNNIIHWGARRDSTGAFIVTNRRIALQPAAIIEYEVTPDELEAMTLDLWKIALHITVETDRFELPKDLYRREMRQTLHASWRYKSGARVAPRPQTPKTASARKRQQLPSDE